ncbi:hypothetical protein N656DRAFT_834702 [Canariomyces notabilis]|jgi:hypothetical protein|uniref:DUF4440 domain-containing protein n=1 Tax=Canariomyces notabilis TaxID=2074819 RepID=A0AAN6TK99_9PEZI|nr:hypothetical protein N656DRAFT_834702 [Canariomyces arenarius]
MPTVLGLTNEKSKNSGYTPSSNTMGSNARLDTISKRNHAAAREMETILWRALLDEPDTARDYIAHDCVMINPLLAPHRSTQPLSKDTQPRAQDVLASSGKGLQYSGFRFHGDPLVVEVDLMAVALVYKLSLYKQTRKGTREIVCTGSSTWRQTAGADWLLVAMHVAEVDEVGEDEE